MTRRKNSAGQRGGRQRRILVRGVRRETPDVRKLSRALIELAMAQAEADAQAAPQPDISASPTGEQPSSDEAAHE